MGCAGEVVGRQPDSVGMARLLAIEELFTFIQPAERVIFVIVGGDKSLWKRGTAEPAVSGGMCGRVGARSMGAVDMAADGDGNGAPCIIDDRDGTGEGEGGNKM